MSKIYDADKIEFRFADIPIRGDFATGDRLRIPATDLRIPLSDEAISFTYKFIPELRPRDMRDIPISVTIPDTRTDAQREADRERMARETFDARYPPKDPEPLTLDEVNDVLGSITIKDWPFKGQRFTAYAYVDGLGATCIRMELSANVPERHDPRQSTPLNFYHNMPFRPEQLTREFLLRNVVRDFLLRIVSHELDESIMVAGARVFDPHEGGRMDL